MNALVRERAIKKTDWAVVRNRPPKEQDTIEHFLRKNDIQNKSYIASQNAYGAQKASLTYRLIGASDRFFLLEVDLHTGRHHQIRAQLAAIGCPVKGDLKYGDRRSNPDGSISLHSRKTEFIHPIKKEQVTIIAPAPFGFDMFL
jgi:23S rRNA pseudouridine1911/1915/1917 synthase